MKRGDHVQCRCAPGCAASWVIPGAIVGRLPDGSVSYAPAPPRGQCIRGRVLRLKKRRGEPGEALIRQDHGGRVYYVPIGYGQYARREDAAEVWTLVRSLVPVTS